MFEYFDKMGVPQSIGFKVAESVRKGKKIPADALPILIGHNVPQ
jgi:DNA polymerase III alpha subunit (gram-positive type)